MSFHGHLNTDAPPDGDYVRYIRSLVGDPPEDVEQAARELALRLGLRNPPADPAVADAGLLEAPAPAPVRASVLAPVSLPASTPMPSTATAGRRGPTLRQAFSRVLIVIGAILAGLGVLAPEAISMLPGILLLFAGLAIGRKQTRTSGRPLAGRQ